MSFFSPLIAFAAFFTFVGVYMFLASAFEVPRSIPNSQAVLRYIIVSTCTSLVVTSSLVVLS